jgi:hypothetical protein
MVLRVGLKFCGECDPAYDRSAYWTECSVAAKGRIDWVRVDEGGYGVALVLCACPTACPAEEMEFDPACRVVVVRDDKTPPGRLVEKLLE